MSLGDKPPSNFSLPSTPPPLVACRSVSLIIADNTTQGSQSSSSSKASLCAGIVHYYVLALDVVQGLPTKCWNGSKILPSTKVCFVLLINLTGEAFGIVFFFVPSFVLHAVRSCSCWNSAGDSFSHVNSCSGRGCDCGCDCGGGGGFSVACAAAANWPLLLLLLLKPLLFLASLPPPPALLASSSTVAVAAAAAAPAGAVVVVTVVAMVATTATTTTTMVKTSTRDSPHFPRRLTIYCRGGRDGDGDGTGILSSCLPVVVVT